MERLLSTRPAGEFMKNVNQEILYIKQSMDLSPVEEFKGRETG